MILDIFAQNAHTLEGKAQVELALLRYRLPRLRRGAKANLSQQRGGVGTRVRHGRDQARGRPPAHQAPHHQARGATCASWPAPRTLQRKSRARSGLATVTIVGYTNAGKSTLLNRLTHAGVLVEDRLFATLDPTTRRLSLPGGEPVLLTDTVGFVRRLPHGLIEAFKSTLEVATTADFLVHVVDSSAADPEGQIAAVHTVLGEIDALDVPELLVFNKADLAPDAAKQLRRRPRGLGRHQRGDRRGHRRAAADARRPAAGARHGRRAARSRTTAATCSPRCIVRARSSRRRTRTAACASARGWPRRRPGGCTSSSSTRADARRAQRWGGRGAADHAGGDD